MQMSTARSCVDFFHSMIIFWQQIWKIAAPTHFQRTSLLFRSTFRVVKGRLITKKIRYPLCGQAKISGYMSANLRLFWGSWTVTTNRIWQVMSTTLPYVEWERRPPSRPDDGNTTENCQVSIKIMLVDTDDGQSGINKDDVSWYWWWTVQYQ